MSVPNFLMIAIWIAILWMMLKYISIKERATMNEEKPDTVVPTLAQKEQLVEYTFPNIYREIT